MGASLRRRLALLSSSLAGGLLVGFALLSGWLTYQAKLDRLDAQLNSRLLPLGGRLRGGDSRPNLERGLAQELGLASPQAVAILLLDRTGQVRYQSPWWPAALPMDSLWAGLPDPIDWPEPGRNFRGRLPADSSPSRTFTWGPAGQRWRVVGRVTPLGQGAIAVNLRTLHQEMATLLRIYGLTIPAALVAIGGGAWWLAGRALQPVNELSRALSQVTAQGLHQRLPTTGAVEFEPLITQVNAMLERLERSFYQASRFSGDAAHELKTPLAILQGELEQAIQQAEVGSPMQQTLGHLLEEVSRLSSIVRKLVLLSLADAGQISLQQEPVNLSTLLQEQLEDLPLLAPELRVTTAIEPGLAVMGDRDLLVQAIQNLLSNAIKYNRPQGWVRVEGQQHQGQVQITVANAAQPLTPEEQTRLFDRFYRGDPARSRTTDGLGLGLSLAREIARAHGGELSLAPSPPTAVHLCLVLPLGVGSGPPP